MQNFCIAERDREEYWQKKEKERRKNVNCGQIKKWAAICVCGRVITINNLAQKAIFRSLDHSVCVGKGNDGKRQRF